MKTICFIFSIFFGLATTAFADSEYINMQKVTQRTYSCSNGGRVNFSPTRYGNVWKVIFSKEGSLNQFGFVNFYNQTDYFKGDVTTWMTFPESRDELPQTGRTSFYMEVKHTTEGLEMTLESTRNSNNKFICRNY